MATFIETKVLAQVRMERDAAGVNHIYVMGESQTDSGMTIRSFPEQDVQGMLTPGELAYAVGILDWVVAHLKTAWSIT